MAAPTAAPTVAKLGLQTLNITSLKLIPPHLTFEAEIKVQIVACCYVYMCKVMGMRKQTL